MKPEQIVAQAYSIPHDFILVKFAADVHYFDSDVDAVLSLAKFLQEKREIHRGVKLKLIKTA